MSDVKSESNWNKPQPEMSESMHADFIYRFPFESISHIIRNKVPNIPII